MNSFSAVKIWSVVTGLILFATISSTGDEGKDSEIFIQELKPGEQALLNAREEIYQEWVHFQIMGRAHSASEKERIRNLEKALMLLNAASSLLDYPQQEQFSLDPELRERLEQVLNDGADHDE